MHWPFAAEDFVRLRDTLAWVAERSPYYRRLFTAAGVRPGELHTYDDFRTRVARTQKADLAANQRAHPPFGEFLAVPREEIASLHTSPGPIYIPRLAEERGGTPVLVEAIAAMGVRPREVAHVTLSYHVMPGGLRLHRAFEEYGCLVINGGTGASRLQVQIAHDYGATVYAGTPSFLANLADTAREMGLPLPYRVGFSTAEALTPALRQRLRAALGIELFVHPAQIYAVTSQFPELGRFQVVVEHPAGERYERATLRAGTVRPPADADALRRTLAERLKATVLIQMEVALVPEGDVPETAGPPGFAEAVVKR